MNKNNEQPRNLSNNDKIEIMNKDRQKKGRPRKNKDKNLTRVKKKKKLMKIKGTYRKLIISFILKILYNLETITLSI